MSSRILILLGLVIALLFFAPQGMAAASLQQSVKKWETLAHGGDAEAQYQLGAAFLSAGNRVEAQEWLSRAAESGHIAAQLQLAQLLLVDGKKAEAARWISRAAEAGNADAQVAYGMLLQQGSGVTKDEAEAARQFGLAAEQGSEQGRFLLAISLYHGTGVAQDYSSAMEMFRALAKKGNPDAQYNIGVMYLKGEGVTQSDEQAAAWFSLAAQGYKKGPRRKAVVAQLETLHKKLGREGNRKATALYDRYVDVLVKEGVGIAAPPAARATPPLPPDQRQASSDIAPQGEGKPGFSGFVQAGVRYQTNANSAASSYLNNPTPAAAVLPISDTNQFLLGRLAWTTDAPWMRAKSFDTDLVLYKTYQNDPAVVDLTYAELTAGPQFLLKGLRWKSTVRPYVSGSFIETNNRLYQTSGGAGINYRGVIDRKTALVVSAEETYAHYVDSVTQPTNSDLSGWQSNVSARLVRLLFPRLVGTAAVTLTNYEAREDWFSYDGFSLLNGYTLKLPGLLKSAPKQNVEIYAGVSFQRRLYDDPNPAVSPIFERNDSEWQFTLTGTLPVTEDLSVTTTLQRTERGSTLSNYEYDNSTYSVAALFRF